MCHQERHLQKHQPDHHLYLSIAPSYRNHVIIKAFFWYIWMHFLIAEFKKISLNIYENDDFYARCFLLQNKEESASEEEEEEEAA